MATNSKLHYTVPGMSDEDAGRVVDLLQDRLYACELDLVTQDMFIGQIERLELFHWFIRAHLEDRSGHLSTEDASTEKAAAAAAGQ